MRKHKQNGGKRSIGRTVYRIVIFVLISLLVGSLVYSFNAKHVMHDQMPMPLGIGVSYVLSPSMEPTLHVDDLVFIRRSGSYEVGDVIIYQERNSLVIHRIIETDGKTLVTKGDNNNTADSPIELSCVKGKMVFSVGRLGAIVRILQTTMASSLSKILLILAAVFLLRISWRKEKDSSDQELDKIKAEIRKLKEEQYPDAPAPAPNPAPAPDPAPEQSAED